MRLLIPLLLLVPAAPALAQPSADTTAHAVPFGAAGNALELAVANASSDTPLDGVTVALVGAPAWLHFAQPEASVGAVAPGTEGVAAFAFDVDPASPVGAPAEVTFEVRRARGVVATKALRLVVEPPREVALVGPWPNPAGGRATLAFELPAPSRISLAVYDVLGREVARVAEGERPAGRHEAALEVGGLASGVYVVRLVVEGADGRREARARRLTVVR